MRVLPHSLLIFGFLAGALFQADLTLAADYRETRIPPGKSPLQLEYGLHPALRDRARDKQPIADPMRLLSPAQERRILTETITWERARARNESYNLNTMGERFAELSESRRRSSELFGMVRSYQGQQMRASLNEADRQGRVSRALVLGATLVATYFGNPISQSLSSSLELRGYANLPKRSGALGFYSSRLGQLGMEYDPENQLKISSKSDLSGIGVSTQLVYGSLERAVDALVTRSFAPLWSTTVGARIPAGETSKLASPQTVVRVDFGTSF